MSAAIAKYGLVDTSALLLPPKPLPLPPRATEYLEDMMARPSGISAIEYPGQRLAHGVFLMRRLGVQVETIQERHDGPHAGVHARYQLKSRVVRLGDHSMPSNRADGTAQALAP